MLVTALGLAGPSCKSERAPDAEIFLTARTHVVQVTPPRSCSRHPAGRNTDQEGWLWHREDHAWCRQNPLNGVVQQWEDVERGAATHLLAIERGSAVLSPLRATVGRPDLAITNCDESPRMQHFRLNNWLSADVREGGCQPLLAEGSQIRLEAFSVNGLDFPVLVSRPIAAPERSIVYVTGGPYAGVVRDRAIYRLVDYLLREHAQSAAIYVPAYLGTDPMVVDGLSGITRGTIEVAALIRQASGDGRLPVCVIGGSLGGYVTAGLAAQFPSARFLLINPIVSTPRRMLELAMRNGHRKSTLFLRGLTILRSGQNARYADVGPRYVPNDEAFLRYFAGSEDVPLARRFTRSVGNTMIVYSPTDQRTGVDEIETLVPVVGRDSLVRTSPAAHEYEEPANFGAYEPAVRRFLSQC